MKEQKPTSIKSVGQLVALFSGLVTFSNAMGALAFFLIGMEEEFKNQDTNTLISTIDPIDIIFAHYFELCILMVTAGVLMLIGGIYIKSYQLWANKLVSVISLFLIIIIWGLMLTMSHTLATQKELSSFSVGPIISAIFFSGPLAYLTWFLYKNKHHFDQ
jgi:hypothetical protein